MPADPDSILAAVGAATAADDKKATDLVLLDVSDILRLVDVFVLASAGSDRQLNAIRDEVERVLREEHDRKPLRREGTPESGWLLLDFGDVVCHLFTEEQRDFYALERLWSDVARLDPATGEILESASASPGDASA